MIPAGQLTGIVQAGGRSSLPERDLAAFPHEGRPMWERQVSVLRAAGADPIALVRQPGQSPLGLPDDLLLWHDEIAGIGPLAGLHTALSHCRTSLLAVLAVDLPRIDAWWYQWLGSFCGSAVGAIACRPDGLHEPLAAIYPRAALAETTRHLAGPDHSLQSLAGSLIGQNILRRVPLPEGELWRVGRGIPPSDRA